MMSDHDVHIVSRLHRASEQPLQRYGGLWPSLAGINKQGMV